MQSMTYHQDTKSTKTRRSDAGRSLGFGNWAFPLSCLSEPINCHCQERA
jgi:hypothetical protein